MIGDAIASVIGKVIDRAWPDPAAKAQAAQALAELQQAGEFKQIDAALEAARMQSEVNKVEAASPDRFVAGWRPFIGWVCGAAFAWHFIGSPVAVWLAAMAGSTATMPNIEMGDLFTLLLGMLGLGSMRTVEKLKGAA